MSHMMRRPDMDPTITWTDECTEVLVEASDDSNK